ncbi:hypothetical protein DSO57_1031224 [Entomophthora muscae]|uniref:Uncharacterized protein n=1 Tax=Entomophthora muscae TaxID=34485 RepID=A0ACC2TN27_9FUNG|nr:hypothetical protein DSO57_1031224 [Entomophthora muscae]
MEPLSSKGLCEVTQKNGLHDRWDSRLVSTPGQPEVQHENFCLIKGCYIFNSQFVTPHLSGPKGFHL